VAHDGFMFKATKLFGFSNLFSITRGIYSTKAAGLLIFHIDLLTNRLKISYRWLKGFARTAIKIKLYSII